MNQAMMIPARIGIKSIRGRFNSAVNRPVNQILLNNNGSGKSTHDISTRDNKRSNQSIFESQFHKSNNEGFANESLYVNKLKKSISNSDMKGAINAYSAMRNQDWSELSNQLAQDYLTFLVKSNNQDTHKIQNCIDQVLNDVVSHNIKCDAQIYSSLIHFYVSIGKYQKALSLANDMKNNGLRFNIESFVSMIVCYQKIGDYNKCLKTFEEAQRSCRDLKYSRYLADRTVMKVYAMMGQIDQSKKIMGELLEKLQSDQEIKVVKLSYLDACAESNNQQEFLSATENFGFDNQLNDSEICNHILINYSKLGLFDKTIGILDRVSGNEDKANFGYSLFKKSSQCYTIQSVLQKAQQYHLQLPSPSTFSDILFEILKQIKANPNDSRLIWYSEQIYERYHDTILKQYQKLVTDAVSIVALNNLTFQKVVGSHIMSVPEDKLYQIMIRNQSVFIAMAQIYHHADLKDQAVRVVQEASQYKMLKPIQLKNIFGNQYNKMEQLSFLIDQ